MRPAMVIAAVILYFAVILGASLALSRKGSSSDFFRGSGRSPWPVVAIAMVGTSISGVTFVSVPGMVAASEFSYLQMALGFIAGYAVIAYVLLPLYYSRRMNSLYCYVEERFGAWSYHTSAAFFLLSKVLGCGVKMYLTATVLQLVLFAPLGIPFWLNIALTMLIVYLYTFRGGVRTLVWTDMLQTLCMIGAVVLSIVFIGKGMGLDIGGICNTVRDSGMTRMWFFDDPSDTRYFWKQFLAGMFTTIAMTGLDQDMMQKNLSCRSLHQSRKNMLSYGVAFVPVNFLFLCLGVLLYSFAASRGIQVSRPDDLFPTIACGSPGQGTAPYMPPAVSLLFVLGLISSAFSSSGSSLTSITTSVTVDLLRADRRLPEQRLRRVRSAVHIAAAAVMGVVIAAFRLIGSESVINAVYTVASYTYGPLLGLFAFGIFTRRRVLDKAVPFICTAAPLLCLMLATHSEQWFGWKIGFELLIINALLTFIGLAAFSLRPGRTDLPVIRHSRG
ncbi:MAG: sodium:solute symporter [Bacteroides sp. CAG:1060_57_27]|nr:MAG: sodium:solute symporter [Bacteroides sp. CAG:1060_57_27]